MNNLPVSVTYIILRRLNLAKFHELASVIKYAKARGWNRSIDNCMLFRVMYMRDYSDPIEQSVWKKVFPHYPRLHLSYEKNYESYNQIILELVIQDSISQLNTEEDYHMRNVVSDIRAFIIPDMNYSMMYQLLHNIVDPIWFIDAVVQLYNWPACFDSKKIGARSFWSLASDLTEKYCMFLKYGRDDAAMLEARRFILKYHQNLIFDNNAIHWYKCLTQDILFGTPTLYNIVQWARVTMVVPLCESVLAAILDCFVTRKPYHGQYPNVSFIALNQRMSEAFIERWFADGICNQDHLWANIFKNKTLNLSQGFREKYGDRGGVSATSALRDMIHKM